MEWFRKSCLSEKLPPGKTASRKNSLPEKLPPGKTASRKTCLPENLPLWKLASLKTCLPKKLSPGEAASLFKYFLLKKSVYYKWFLSNLRVLPGRWNKAGYRLWTVKASSHKLVVIADCPRPSASIVCDSLRLSILCELALKTFKDYSWVKNIK